MRAILSDIHGSLEALTATLADISAQGVHGIDNLGDTLGYGPNPLECLDISMAMSVVLLGNFDHAVMFNPHGFCQGAEQSILWTQSQLRTVGTELEKQTRHAYLADRPRSRRESGPSGQILYVHGSARNPTNEYLFPDDVHNREKLDAIAATFDGVCFGGHTHDPGIFQKLRSGKWDFIYPEECSRGFPVGGRKVICNVGSVGQPRDGDERACYALFDGHRIWFRRVAYDLETTIRKIYAVPELLDFLGDRLREGR